MSRTARIAQKVVKGACMPVADLPVFLCPGVLRSTVLRQPAPFNYRQQSFSLAPRRRNVESGSQNVPTSHRKSPTYTLENLPIQCTGCGAFTQTVEIEEAGYFTPTRKSVRLYLDLKSGKSLSSEDEIVKNALENAGSAFSAIKVEDFSTQARNIDPPVCDRCHNLKHHDTGRSIHHPSVHSVQDTIFESPYKYNHVYHVIDAADFPMSLVPGLHKLLHLTPLRSRNRRSKTGRFYHGRKTEVSFVITRADLLASQKSQVDSMMSYLRAVLRDALGRTAIDVRLGNIRCVSAKQGWWTKELKEEIWKRGGAGWLVGKVNVGKSKLFHDIFPKGRMEKGLLNKKGTVVATPKLKDTEDISYLHAPSTEPLGTYQSATPLSAKKSDAELEAALGGRLSEENQKDEILDTYSLLPPAPEEVEYPTMPLVSALPGTTASPIRLSFGSGKGELIDLPGLSRGDLELHVKPEHRFELVMRDRIVPNQIVLKPQQSLLLGGFIRITPTDPNVIILSYAFTPIHPHGTSTMKAIGIQNRSIESSVENISLPDTAEKIASAGIFHLKYDVTKERAGPITASNSVGIHPDRLPYKILATDILIEGCGWVELVAQVRKPWSERKPAWAEKGAEKNAKSDTWASEDTVQEIIDPTWPAVEVFSPNGKFISARRPMNAWLKVLEKPRKSSLQGRPRKSMRHMKKQEKIQRRAKTSLL